MNKKQKKVLVRILITAALLALLNLVQLPEIPAMLLYLAAYLIIGYDILRKAGKGILNGRVFDENFLMAVATIGAVALAASSSRSIPTRSRPAASSSCSRAKRCRSTALLSPAARQ